MRNQNISTSQMPTTARVNWRVDDFCQAHGIGRTLAYEEIKRGELNIIKVGSRTLIPDIEARAWQRRKAEAGQ
jgi:hypothetical protein